MRGRLAVGSSRTAVALASLLSPTNRNGRGVHPAAGGVDPSDASLMLALAARGGILRRITKIAAATRRARTGGGPQAEGVAEAVARIAFDNSRPIQPFGDTVNEHGCAVSD
jgi:hypothetical protein